MSAITGIFYRDGREVSHNQIKKMNDSLAHRGRDGSRVWFDGSVAFGHQMLHTTQESLHERLPFKDENSGMVITADARIDNRAELASLLKLEDSEWVPDSTFILEAYKIWGEHCPEKLLGDFAFAVWDPKKEQLFCARDHMGVKPFYYCLFNEAFFFATEIKALFCLPDVFQEINELKVAFHLISIDDKTSTFYKDVFRLSAAHSITVSSNESKIRKYWELDPNLKIELDSDEDYIKAFREIFTEAVKCRLRSAFPVGFELSGGLDSSSVTCVAKKILSGKEGPHQSLKTFSFIFKDFPDADESYYIKKVVNTGEIEPHFICVDNVSPLKEVKNILWTQDGPFSSKNESVMWNLYRKMYKNNIRVVFTGEDGDSVISKGQNYLRELAITFQWKKLFKEIKDTSILFKKNKSIYDKSESVFIKTSFDKSFHSILIKQVIFPLIPEFLKKGFRVIYNKKNHVRFKPDLFLLNKRFKEKLKLVKYLDKNYKSQNQCKTPKKYHQYLINSHERYKVLEMINNRAAAFSIEARHPFLDKRLVEFCYAIPTEMKYRSGWDRFILRKSMEGILPEEVQKRFFKQDLNPPIQKNLLLEKELINKVVYNDNKRLEDYLDLPKLKKVYNNYRSQNRGKGVADSVSGLADITDVWLVITLYLWLYETNLKS